MRKLLQYIGKLYYEFKSNRTVKKVLKIMPFILPFISIYNILRRDREMFYDAEYDTWFRTREEDMTRWNRQQTSEPPKPKPKYKMTPHKFE